MTKKISEASKGDFVRLRETVSENGRYGKHKDKTFTIIGSCSYSYTHHIQSEDGSITFRDVGWNVLEFLDAENPKSKKGNSLERLEDDLVKAEAKVARIKMRIEYMKASKVETFKEKEFKIWSALATLKESENLTVSEQFALIKEIIN